MVILDLTSAMDKEEWYESVLNSIDTLLLHKYKIGTEAKFDMLVTFQTETSRKKYYDIKDVIERLNSHLSNISVLKGEYNKEHRIYMNKLGTLIGELTNSVYNVDKVHEPISR